MRDTERDVSDGQSRRKREGVPPMTNKEVMQRNKLFSEFHSTPKNFQAGKHKGAGLF